MIQTLSVMFTICASLCLAHFAIPSDGSYAKLQHAKQLHSAAGFDHMHKVSLSDIVKFEKHLNVKIIVLNHGSERKRLQLFQTNDAIHPQTI